MKNARGTWNVNPHLKTDTEKEHGPRNDQKTVSKGAELRFFKPGQGLHYSVGNIEVKDVQSAKMPKQLVGMQCAYWGNVVKYMLRCGWKGTLLKDLKKAQNYLDWLIEDVEKNSKG